MVKICIDNRWQRGRLTIGKKYEVIPTYTNRFIITDDTGTKRSVDRRKFCDTDIYMQEGANSSRESKRNG